MNRTIGVVVAAALAAGACTKESEKKDAAQHHPPAPVSGEPASTEAATADEPPAQPTLADRLAEAATLSDALAITLPEMKDTTDDTSLGALGLSMWSASHLHFADVAVRHNETSAKLILKDSDRERGKRMCARGGIVQIEKTEVGGVTIFDGLMMKYDGTVISFLAAGDTGELVRGQSCPLLRHLDGALHLQQLRRRDDPRDSAGRHVRPAGQPGLTGGLALAQLHVGTRKCQSWRRATRH